MTESAIRLGESGELLLSGVLDYSTGPALRKQGQALINASTASALVLDCSAVVKSSSVGLSLLLCFMRPTGETIFMDTNERFGVLPSLKLQQEADARFGEETYYAKVDTTLPDRAPRRWERKAESGNGGE